MNNNDLVTVLLPVFNAEKYLKYSIESILSQSYKNFLLLIINDGSTDKSQNIINQYHDKRIKTLHFNQNIGLIRALNVGLDNSKGKYIIRMDADDISDNNRIEEQVKFMDSNPDIGVSGCGSRTFGENVNSWDTVYPSAHEEIKVKLTHNTSLSHPTVIFNKNLLGSTRYNVNFKHIEDYELWVRTIDKFKFGNLNKILLSYRIHENQISSVHRDRQSIIANDLRIKMLKKGGLNPNTKEIDLHKRICSYEFIRDMNFISDSSKWFNKIFTFNLKTQYFSNSPLRIFYFNFFLNILNETKMISPIILAKYYITNPMFRGLYKKKFINYLISNKYEF